MFKSAYATTPCAAYNMEHTISEIEKHRILSGSQFQHTPSPVDGKPLWGLTRVTPGLADIPPFAHPLIFVPSNGSTPGQELKPQYTTYIDVRNFTRIDREGNVVVAADLDYNLAVYRGALQEVWSGENYLDIQNLGDLPLMVYARWMAEIINRRLALTPDVQVTVTVIAAYFYLNMFLDHLPGQPTDKLEDKEIDRMAVAISRCTYMNAAAVIDIIKELPPMRDVHDFLQALKAFTNSERFAHFDLALLYQIVVGSWFGSSAPEITKVAIEHPPTWVAMVALAAEERGYYNTTIGKIVQTNKNSDVLKSFNFNVKHLLKTQ